MTSFKLNALSVLFLCVFFSGISFAFAQEVQPAQTVSLQMALEHAYQNNPELRAARSALKATQERLPQAQAGWKPSVSSNAGVFRNDVKGGTDGSSTSKTLGVSLDQPLYKGGSTFAQNAAARDFIKARTAQVRAQEQDVLLRVVTAYMDVLRDQALLNLSKNNRDLLFKQFEATQDRYTVGELTRTDVGQSQARLARASSDVITARGDLNTSFAVFEEVIGLSPTAVVQPDIDLPVPASLEQAIATAKDVNPEIISAVYAHKAAEEDVGGVAGELWPQVGIVGSWDKTYDPSPGLIDEQTTGVIGVQATIPLYEAGATRSRVRQAKHTANQRYIDILDVKNRVQKDAVSAWAEWSAAQAEIVSRKAQVEAAGIAQTGVHQEADLGARTILDALDADQEYLEAQVSLVTAQRNEVVSKFRLLATLGQLTPLSLGFAAQEIDYQQNLDDITGKIFDMSVETLQE